MRVTQNQLTRQYLQNSNKSLSNMNTYNNRVLTQRKFLRASEDSVGASKALIIRRNLVKNDMYKTNLETADSVYENGEQALRTISSVSTTITDTILQGVNGTTSSDTQKITAQQIRNLAKEMIGQINVDFADRKLFGGTNNETSPFVYDETTGKITYNGVDINSQNLSDFPMSKDIYVDVGLGMKFDASGNVDKQTVMNISLNGAKYLGHGTDADGDPNNIIALAFKAANAIENGDTSSSMKLLDKMNAAKSNLMIGITNIGNLQQSVTYNQSRIEDSTYSLKVAQQATEGVDVTEEITNLKVAEMAYNATLSMGSNLIPKSIFDYMR